MRFQWLQGDMPPLETVQADYRSARKAGQVRLGELCVYLPKFPDRICLPYGDIAWAYLRQEEVTAKMCCGRANFDRFFLMLQGPGETMYRGELPTRQAGDDALARISAANPETKIGYYKNKTD